MINLNTSSLQKSPEYAGSSKNECWLGETGETRERGEARETGETRERGEARETRGERGS